jgi:hypothetical protein
MVMAANQGAPSPAYTVESITPEDDISTPGQVVPSHRVRFTADNGVSSSILIPNTRLPDVAAGQAEIEAKIALLTQYLNLGKK